jgi:predicted dehydrogenase
MYSGVAVAMTKIKLVQVGLGGHGEHVGTHYVLQSEDFVYAGVVDVGPARLALCGERLFVPEERRFSDFLRALEQLEADAVLIETASAEHYAVCSDALRRGLQVLVEKPFTLDITQAKALAADAKSRGLVLMINQNYRYYPSVLALKSALRSGAFRNPLFVQCQFYILLSP